MSLSSEKLGITAKIDLVEVDGGEVIPVEYKRSAKPDVPGGAYLPELAQVCAQVLLLREHGYSCGPASRESFITSKTKSCSWTSAPSKDAARNPSKCRASRALRPGKSCSRALARPAVAKGAVAGERGFYKSVRGAN